MSEEKKIIPEGQMTDEALDAATGGDGTEWEKVIKVVFYECPNPECRKQMPDTALIGNRWFCLYCKQPVSNSAKKIERTFPAPTPFGKLS